MRAQLLLIAILSASLLGGADSADFAAGLGAATRRKDWPAMEALCREAMASQPQAAMWPYNLACALALQDRPAEALAALRHCAGLGFTDDAWMRDDPDLASLRQDPAFVAICDAIHAQALALPCDPGADIPGVRSIEDWPVRGLRYRLRLPIAASPAHPARLVLWLHPSGGSANALAEDLVPGLAARNLALLVCTGKDWLGWSRDDAQRLLGVTVPALAGDPAIDIRRPYLLGFSAGGQMALRLWQEQPAAFAGLMLSAAYPIEAGEEGYPPMRLPAQPAGSRIFALVGAKDPGVATFLRIEGAWQAAGVDLTWLQVPGRGHAFLFAGREREALFRWLDAGAQAEADAGRPPPGQATEDQHLDARQVP